MKRLSVLLLAIVVAITCDKPVVLNPYGSISGVVIDSRTVAPLAGARISLSPTGSSQITGQDGTFLFDRLQAQDYTLVVSKEGYKSDQQKVTVNPGQTSSAHISLTASSGSFSVTPAELDFGSSTTSMKIQVRNASGTPTNYSTQTSNKWLTVTPETGTITQSDYLTILVSREGLSPGDYMGEVTIRYDGETLIVPVKMSIMSNTAASISLESIFEVGAHTAKAKAALTSIGASSVTKMGICWSATNTAPTVNDESTNQGDAYAPCDFTALLTGLKAETTYYCRAYAQNAYEITYSDPCMTIITASEQSGGSEETGIAVKQGLMFYLSFDGGTVQDESDNNLETIAIGAPSFLTDTPSGSGMSLSLNGTKGQYISVPYALFDDLNNYSITFWAKDFSVGSFVSALSIHGVDYASANRPKVYLSATGKLIFDTYGRTASDSQYWTPPFSYPFTDLQSDKWHHFCVTLDIPSFRHAEKKLYVDGVFVDTIVDDTCIQNTTKVIIGGDAEGGYAVSMTTKIDNVRFYNRTLSKEEVNVLYNSEK